MAGLIAETTFNEDPKNPAPDADQGGVNIHEHAKKLCVNKLGQTMVVPPKGAFVSPLIEKPFLLNKKCFELIEAATLPNSTLSNPTLPNHNLHLMRKANLTDPLQEISHAQKNSKIEYAFWILAAMQIPVVIILSVLVAKDFFGWNNRYDLNTPGFVETKEGIEMNRASISRNSITAAASEDRPMVSKLQLILLVGSTVAILFIYDGLQAYFGSYLYSYLVIESLSVKNVHDEVSSFNSCYWGLFVFGRLISIRIATKLTPAFMLSINIIGCLCTIILMLFFLQSRLVIYIGTALFALFLSSVYPTSVTLAETYINVTSFIASILVVAAASGEMLGTPILDYKTTRFCVNSEPRKKDVVKGTTEERCGERNHRRKKKGVVKGTTEERCGERNHRRRCGERNHRMKGVVKGTTDERCGERNHRRKEYDEIERDFLLTPILIMILLSCFFYIVVNVVGDSIIRQSSERSVMQRIKNLFCLPNEEEKVTEDSGQSPQIQI
ncbi:hypothetical protein Anas_05612 [Armadillidium nasatum]|uniref:Uncharacterized protein n=1 Tax=Armadillidium nasatum TaxID=96803 RepID=A0A5N5TCP0_9CRUS|nr:hypothetical protein Anas_05612 [Armadillidium nasatum]